jgi:hypothetical protein
LDECVKRFTCSNSAKGKREPRNTLIEESVPDFDPNVWAWEARANLIDW